MNGQNLLISSGDNIFKINKFTGTLDLLLKLIKNKKIDILSISVSDIVDQYLMNLKKLLGDNFDLAGIQLVITTYFLRRKSNLLIPIPLEDDSYDEEELEQLEKLKLISRLVEYERYAKLIEPLRNNYNDKMMNFSKDPSDLFEINEYYERNIKHKYDNYAYSDINTEMLAAAFKKILLNNRYKNRTENIAIDEIDPLKQKQVIIDLLKKNNEISVIKICKNYSIRYFLVTFITMLELAMKGIIRIKNSDNKNDVYAYLVGKNNE